MIDIIMEIGGVCTSWYKHDNCCIAFLTFLISLLDPFTNFLSVWRVAEDTVTPPNFGLTRSFPL